MNPEFCKANQQTDDHSDEAESALTTWLSASQCSIAHQQADITWYSGMHSYGRAGHGCRRHSLWLYGSRLAASRASTRCKAWMELLPASSIGALSETPLCLEALQAQVTPDRL